MLGFSLPSHCGRTITTGRLNWSTMNPMRRISARLCQKAYLKGDGNLASLVFRPKAFFSDQRIELIPAKAEAIDRGKKIRLSAGAELQYGHLVLAVGARSRELGSPHELALKILMVRLAAVARTSTIEIDTDLTVEDIDEYGQ
jgi:NADH dehydrogenase FAD-containing subunit